MTVQYRDQLPDLLRELNLPLSVCELEDWKDVVGYEEYYAISSIGRVISYPRKVWSVKNNCYANRKGRLLKQKHTYDGYRTITLHVDTIRKETMVHRLIAQAFIPNFENKAYVNHIDGNKQNNHIDNLEWVTASENCIHAIKTGLAPSLAGEGNIKSSITEEQAIYIKQNYFKQSHGNKQEFASHLPISNSVVKKIAYGTLWSHLNNYIEYGSKI